MVIALVPKMFTQLENTWKYQAYEGGTLTSASFKGIRSNKQLQTYPNIWWFYRIVFFNNAQKTFKKLPSASPRLVIPKALGSQRSSKFVSCTFWQQSIVKAGVPCAKSSNSFQESPNFYQFPHNLPFLLWETSPFCWKILISDLRNRSKSRNLRELRPEAPCAPHLKAAVRSSQIQWGSPPGPQAGAGWRRLAPAW